MDEERVAGRLVRDGFGPRLRTGRLAAEQRQCEVAALGRRQRLESDLSTPSRKCIVSAGDDGLPLIRANCGVITSRLVREIEALTP